MFRQAQSLCAAAVLCCAAGATSAGEIVLDRSVHRGSAPVDYTVTVNDTDMPGYFRFTVAVDTTVNPNIADIVAIYLEFEPHGFNAADWYSDMPGVDLVQQSDAVLRHIMFNTNNVGSGNICGNGDLFEDFDIGIAIGESNGLDAGDDYQTVTFDMAIKAGLTLEDLIGVGVRGNSVGMPDGPRADSAKELVLLPCPPDFNIDGFVDCRDLLAFLNTWSAREPGADFNADGLIDTRDVLAFLNTWVGGCRP